MALRLSCLSSSGGRMKARANPTLERIGAQLVLKRRTVSFECELLNTPRLTLSFIR